MRRPRGIFRDAMFLWGVIVALLSMWCVRECRYELLPLLQRVWAEPAPLTGGAGGACSSAVGAITLTGGTGYSTYSDGDIMLVSSPAIGCTGEGPGAITLSGGVATEGTGGRITIWAGAGN